MFVDLNDLHTPWKATIQRKREAATRQGKDKNKRGRKGRREQEEVREDKEKRQEARNIERCKMLME